MTVYVKMDITDTYEITTTYWEDSSFTIPILNPIPQSCQIIINKNEPSEAPININLIDGVDSQINGNSSWTSNEPFSAVCVNSFEFPTYSYYTFVGVPDCNVSPTPTPTPTATNTPTPTPTATNTPTPTATNTPTPTPTATNTPTPTPTPSAQGDPDATAYLNAVVNEGGTINGTISVAVDTLFRSLKSEGIYNKLLVMYPFVGGVANSHSLNALSPTNLNTYYIGWTAGWTHNVSGASHTNGAYYGNTNFVPSTNLSSVESSMGYYISTSPQVGDGYVMGAYNSGSQWWSANYQFPSNQFFTIHFEGLLYFESLTKLEGFTQTSTSTTNRYQRFSNSIQTVTGTTTAAGTRPTVSIYLGNLNLNGNAHKTNDYSPIINFAYIGNYLTATELGKFADIVQTFQTTLNRQV